MNKHFELQSLAKHLKSHLVENSPEDALEVIDLVSTHFPQFIVTTSAYRFHRRAGGSYIPRPGNSFSASTQGAKLFLYHEEFGFKLTADEELSLITAQISGVDIVTLCKHLVFHDFIDKEDVEIFYPEQEILANEVRDFKVEPYSR